MSCAAIELALDRTGQRPAPTQKTPLSSKPYKVTGPAAGMSTDCAHRISTGNPHWEPDRKTDSSRLKPARNDNGSGRLAARLKPRPFKSHCPGTLVDYATEHIFRHAVPQAQTADSARAHSARAFSAKAGRKTLG